MDIESMIAAIFKRPAIWDRRHKQHSNRIVVDKCWKEAAAELQNEEITIRKKWKYLRDKFAVECGKEMMSRSGDAANGSCPPSKWVFFQELLFLKDIVTPRVSSGSLASLALNASNFADIEVDNPEAEQGQLPNKLESESSLQYHDNTQNEVPHNTPPGDCADDIGHQDTSTSTTSNENASAPPTAHKRKRKAKDYNNKLLKLEEKKVRHLLNKGRKGAEEEDSDLMFYKALLCHVKRIPPERKLQFQGEVQAVVQKYAYPSIPYEERGPYNQSYEGSSYKLISVSPSPSTSRAYEHATERQRMDNKI